MREQRRGSWEPLRVGSTNNLAVGRGFLILVDDVARTAASTEIPIGILTAFIGAPIFAWLLISGGKRS